jgi:predicted PurR-regulated permease PerM
MTDGPVPVPPAGGEPEPDATSPVERLKLSPRSVAVAVGMVAATLVLLRVFVASARVLGWLAAATCLAALLHPAVAFLQRRVPRVVAVLGVVALTLGVIGSVVYLGVDGVRRQADFLQEEAPRAARRLERSERFGDAAREFQLQKRVRQFVEDLPQRLRGGDTATALRSAASRGVAFLASSVLTLFLLVQGPHLVDAGLRQIADHERRRRTKHLLTQAYLRSWRYVVFTLGRAVLAGLFAYVVCRWQHVPAPTLLSLWVAAWSVVPLMGIVVGAIPVVLLALPNSLDRAEAIGFLFVAYQAAEVLLVQRRLEARSMHVGPALTLLAAMAGLELYGVGGLVVSVVVVVFAAAIAHELAPHDTSDLLAAADDLLPGDR